jgi:hypothetical protein
MKERLAIDPMALFLDDRQYWIWTLIKHPNVPKEAEIAELLKSMTLEERKLLTTRAKAVVKMAENLSEYGKVIVKAG